MVLRSKKLFLNVKPFENYELSKQFCFLTTDYTESIKSLYISIFDHILSWEEAEEVLYSPDIPQSELNRRNELLLNFLKSLVSDKKVYTYKYRGRKKDKLQFKTFTSKDALQFYLLPYEHQYEKNFSHKSWTSFVIPEIGALIQEDGEYGYRLYYLKEEYYFH